MPFELPRENLAALTNGRVGSERNRIAGINIFCFICDCFLVAPI